MTPPKYLAYIETQDRKNLFKPPKAWFADTIEDMARLVVDAWSWEVMRWRQTHYGELQKSERTRLWKEIDRLWKTTKRADHE